MNPALSGVRAKIDRAKYHFNQLSAALNTWGAKHADEPVISKLNADRQSFDVPDGDAAPVEDWALFVGDIFHNLRSTLDHLVLQLAIANGADATIAGELTSFPICLGSASFRSSTKDFKRFLSPRAFALIKSIQPYVTANVRGKPPEQSVLYIISKLDNVDKHRMLVVLTAAHKIEDVTLIDETGAIFKPKIRPDVWIPMKDRTQVAAIDLSGFSFDGKPKMHMDM
jgi:hypothetical protein